MRNRGKFTKTGKTGGIRNLWSMTKRRSSEILADENRKFWEKVTFVKFFTHSEKISKTGGNLKQGWGNASWPQGDGRIGRLWLYHHRLDRIETKVKY